MLLNKLGNRKVICLNATDLGHSDTTITASRSLPRSGRRLGFRCWSGWYSYTSLRLQSPVSMFECPSGRRWTLNCSWSFGFSVCMWVIGYLAWQPVDSLWDNEPGCMCVCDWMNADLLCKALWMNKKDKFRPFTVSYLNLQRAICYQ